MCFIVLFLFFFFKQKTAYEMRISDWSSDVCSSDLSAGLLYADRDIAGNTISASKYVYLGAYGAAVHQPFNINSYVTSTGWATDYPLGLSLNYIEIGRASCRERVCQYV